MDKEDKVLLALGVDPSRAFLSDQSIVGDCYYYHFDDYNDVTSAAFDTIVQNASLQLRIEINRKDKIVDIVNKL